MKGGTRMIDELIAWLEQDEANSRPFRAERLQLLITEYGPESIRVFHGGDISMMAFEEARQAYLHGLFLSCTIICQICLEHMLLSLFRQAGRNDLERATFQILLLEARRQEFLSQNEFEIFARNRLTRNLYVHPRSPMSKNSLLHRVVKLDTPFEDLVVDDARLAISALLSICSRPPFAL